MSRIILILIFTFGLLGCSKSNSTDGKKSGTHEHSKTETYYTCSMHPQIREDKPGKCPICHMTLTKVEVELDDDTPAQPAALAKPIWQCEKFPDVTSEKEDTCPIDGSPMIKKKVDRGAGLIIAKVKLRSAQLEHFSPDFFPVTTMKMTKEVRLLGSVLESEEKESSIPARIGGRVEKVFVRSTGSFISIGDPVLQIYSPKLITAGEEYILTRKSFVKNKNSEFKNLLKQSEQRLLLWGIKKSQFGSWYAQGRVPRSITIYSQSTGIVQKRNATVGKYFKEGQNFFELSDLSDVWLEMDVYEQDAALVKLGQRVELEFTSLPGDIYSGEVDFVAPILDAKSRTLKIRSTIKNADGRLKPGMAADATLKISFDRMPLVVPRSAIIDTGKRKVVWLKINKKQFQAKTVLTGIESEGYVEVKDGLMEGEEVVIEGNFLLDAQAQLFGGYEDMTADSSHNH
jgi:hypothetical protein